MSVFSSFLLFPAFLASFVPSLFTPFFPFVINVLTFRLPSFLLSFRFCFLCLPSFLFCIVTCCSFLFFSFLCSLLPNCDFFFLPSALLLMLLPILFPSFLPFFCPCLYFFPHTCSSFLPSFYTPLSCPYFFSLPLYIYPSILFIFLPSICLLLFFLSCFIIYLILPPFPSLPICLCFPYLLSSPILFFLSSFLTLSCFILSTSVLPSIYFAVTSYSFFFSSLYTFLLFYHHFTFAEFVSLLFLFYLFISLLSLSLPPPFFLSCSFLPSFLFLSFMASFLPVIPLHFVHCHVCCFFHPSLFYFLSFSFCFPLLMSFFSFLSTVLLFLPFLLLLPVQTFTSSFDFDLPSFFPSFLLLFFSFFFTLTYIVL